MVFKSRILVLNIHTFCFNFHCGHGNISMTAFRELIFVDFDGISVSPLLITSNN